MNKPMRIRFFFVIVIIGMTSLKGLAQVNFESIQEIEGVRLYGDSSRRDVFYYPPSGMRIVKDREGNPDFNLIMMRYTGRKLSADQQKRIFKNICQFKVSIEMPGEEKLAAIQFRMGVVELIRMPLIRVESFLIYTPALPGDKGFISNAITTGKTNEMSDERTFTIAVSNEDAQLLESAFQKNQTLISVGYAFFSEGLVAQNAVAALDSSAGVSKRFGNFIKTFQDSLNQSLKRKIVLTGSGSVAVTLPPNSEKFIKKLDLNEQLPAEYAALEVRCYDFNNELRSDLYAKKVEIQAISVDGKPISSEVVFYKRSPEIFFKHLKFDYAIRVDTPLRYRITEIDNSGQTFIKGWIENKEWGLVDATMK